MARLAVLASHPVQYYAPLFRELANRLDLTVYYAHNATAHDHAQAGFGVGFSWDVDLLSGYPHVFLNNVARDPGLGRFSGVDTPEISKILRNGRFDALLLMGWYLKSFIQGLAAAKRMGLPVMTRGDSHLDTPRGALKKAAKRAVYPHFLRQFDAALIVGKRNRTYWEHYGYPKERLFNAPHCVDTAFFAERATPAARDALRAQLSIAPEAKVVLFAGKLLPIKRPLDVIEAAALARRDGLSLHVMMAGSGPLEASIRDRADTLDLPLHLLGFCNQTQMPAVYAAADVLVLPSECETWGLVVNEALASGKPVVVSEAVGCAPDLAADGKIGRTFPVGDRPALAHSLGAVLGTPPSADEIKKISQAYGIEAAADGIEIALRRLAAS
ncbi:MAG: glycosyltransferase family 4 protein [Hyphomicrobium sp.]|nr:glycosyltransferase family 4 protein [Hyphomicrobium sp.]